MWYGETGRGKASLMPRPHPTPYQLPCSQHLCCLGLASGSAGSVLRLDPAYLLPAALSPSANWLVAWWQLCTQSPGGERVGKQEEWGGDRKKEEGISGQSQ